MTTITYPDYFSGKFRNGGGGDFCIRRALIFAYLFSGGGRKGTAWNRYLADAKLAANQSRLLMTGAMIDDLCEDPRT